MNKTKQIFEKNQFKKSVKRTIKRYNKKFMNKVYDLINNLLINELGVNHRDHKLVGNYEGCREFHIIGDYLVIYRPLENGLELCDIGTHSDLF